MEKGGFTLLECRWIVMNAGMRWKKILDTKSMENNDWSVSSCRMEFKKLFGGVQKAPSCYREGSIFSEVSQICYISLKVVISH